MATVRTIITRALGELLYLAEGETPTAGMAADGLAVLNDMIAAWRTEGVMLSFPASTNWRGAWATRTVYGADDSVNVDGVIYTCTAQHTSGDTNRPGPSPEWTLYWLQYADPVLKLTDQSPLPAHHQRGLISLLAVELGAMFNKEPSPLTLRKASEGKTALFAAYMPITPVGVDPGLTRLPSNVWPYSSSADNVSLGSGSSGSTWAGADW